MENKNNKDFFANFSVCTVMVNQLPFELMMDLSLHDDDTKNEYDWIWTITIRSFQNDDNGLPIEAERQKLMTFFQDIVKLVSNKSAIKIAGTSLHNGIYDIMLYAKAEDMKEVGGNITSCPETLEDQKGRFLNFSGNPDPNWERFNNYSRAFKSPL